MRADAVGGVVSVHQLPARDVDARIAALKTRHAAELDVAYSQGFESALMYVCFAVAVAMFCLFATFVIVIPVWDWLVS